MERCNFIPPTPGYDGCTREKGHEGPCAHPFVESMVSNDIRATIAFGNCTFKERLQIIWCVLIGRTTTFQRMAVQSVRIGPAQHIKAYEPPAN